MEASQLDAGHTPAHPIPRLCTSSLAVHSAVRVLAATRSPPVEMRAECRRARPPAPSCLRWLISCHTCGQRPGGGRGSSSRASDCLPWCTHRPPCRNQPARQRQPACPPPGLWGGPPPHLGQCAADGGQVRAQTVAQELHRGGYALQHAHLREGSSGKDGCCPEAYWAGCHRKTPPQPLKQKGATPPTQPSRCDRRRRPPCSQSPPGAAAARSSRR